ncbi:hypothetical protein WAK64_12970 [Bacillus spongiae]|uniref:Uncharacterized protein n=1 Tax=Bacillus spongiae TaxID=2683610 RepID=A0ABU8HFA2_9BACI
MVENKKEMKAIFQKLRQMGIKVELTIPRSQLSVYRPKDNCCRQTTMLNFR